MNVSRVSTSLERLKHSSWVVHANTPPSQPVPSGLPGAESDREEAPGRGDPHPQGDRIDITRACMRLAARLKESCE
jgi:hypothetical protein